MTMKNNGFRLVSIASTMALIASLAACGAGGGSDATGSGSGSGNGSGGGSVTPPPSNAVPTTGTLQISAPAPTYTPGSDRTYSRGYIDTTTDHERRRR